MATTESPKGVVAITGGSRGIGAAVARQVAATGRDVAIIHRSDDAAAETLLSELRGSGVRAMRVKADVSDEAAITDAFAQIRSFGRLSGLVNSAGISGGRIPVDSLVGADLSRLFNVNVVGLMLCCREAVKQMAKSHGGQGGAIVNVSSFAAAIGGRGQLSHYAASKGAVDVFTIGAAKDLAKDGIAMFSIRPGVVATEMTSGNRANSDWLEKVEKSIAAGRIAQVDDIAAPIVRLLEPDMAYLTGSRIDAAGGGLVV